MFQPAATKTPCHHKTHCHPEQRKGPQIKHAAPTPRKGVLPVHSPLKTPPTKNAAPQRPRTFLTYYSLCHAHADRNNKESQRHVLLTSPFGNKIQPRVPRPCLFVF